MRSPEERGGWGGAVEVRLPEERRGGEGGRGGRGGGHDLLS